jgi:hypothetical protein
MRDMELTPESAAELDRLIDEAKRQPPPAQACRVETKDASFLR